AGCKESKRLGMTHQHGATPDGCHVVIRVVLRCDGAGRGTVVDVESVAVHEVQLVLENKVAHCWADHRCDVSLAPCRRIDTTERISDHRHEPNGSIVPRPLKQLCYRRTVRRLV